MLSGATDLTRFNLINSDVKVELGYMLMTISNPNQLIVFISWKALNSNPTILISLSVSVMNCCHIIYYTVLNFLPQAVFLVSVLIANSSPCSLVAPPTDPV